MPLRRDNAMTAADAVFLHPE